MYSLRKPTVAEPATVEAAFESVWVELEEGFRRYLADEWLELELTDEQAETGAIYSAASGDGARGFQLSWSERETETTIDDLQAELVAYYADAEIIAAGIAMLVRYTDTENDMNVYVMLDQADTGVYMFCFSPASDGELAATAAWIAASISPVRLEEAGESADEKAEEETGE